MIWKKKKFWTTIKLKKKETEFGILLDDNLLKTPQKKRLHNIQHKNSKRLIERMVLH